MDTNLGQIYKDVFFRLGKDYRGGYLTPENFNLAIKTVNERYMNQLIDVFEKDREVSTDLRPFIKTLGTSQFAPLIFTPVNEGDTSFGGYTNPPDDFWYEARANYTSYTNVGCAAKSEYKQVVMVAQHEFDAIMNDSNVSPILNPKDGQPVIVIQNGLFYVYPFIPRVSFTYIKKPNVPYYDYDIISGMPVFLPAGEKHVNSTVMPQGTPSLTTEFEYPENCVDILTDMIKTQVSINIESTWGMQTQIPPKV